MSIKDFKSKMKKAKGSSTVVRLKDGEKVVGCFVGDYLTYYNTYDAATKTGKQYSRDVPGSKLRFKWNFALKEGDSYTMKIWDGSATVGEELADCIEKYGQNTWLEISRRGEMLDTRYSIMFEAKVAEDELAKVKELQEFDLGKYLEDPHDLSDANEVPVPSDDDAPTGEVPF